MKCCWYTDKQRYQRPRVSQVIPCSWATSDVCHKPGRCRQTITFFQACGFVTVLICSGRASLPFGRYLLYLTSTAQMCEQPAQGCYVAATNAQSSEGTPTNASLRRRCKTELNHMRFSKLIYYLSNSLSPSSLLMTLLCCSASKMRSTTNITEWRGFNVKRRDMSITATNVLPVPSHNTQQMTTRQRLRHNNASKSKISVTRSLLSYPTAFAS